MQATFSNLSKNQKPFFSISESSPNLKSQLSSPNLDETRESLRFTLCEMPLSSPELKRAIKEWNREVRQYLQRDLSEECRKVMNVSATMISNCKASLAQIELFQAKVMVAKDSKKQIRAIALYKNSSEKDWKGTIEIVSLISKPENIFQRFQNSDLLKGSGSFLIHSLIQKCFQLKKKGIIAYPLDNASVFYKKIGFTFTQNEFGRVVYFT